MFTYYSDPLWSSTLVAWSYDSCGSEAELLADIPITLSLFFRATPPIVHGGCAFASIIPNGKAEAAFVPRFARTECPARTPQREGTAKDETAETLPTQLARFADAVREASAQDAFFATSLQLAGLADARYDDPQQVRTRIIEYSVAMESLLLEQECELALRFACRCATLLAGGGERLDDWDTAQTIYKMRSAAVHGSPKGQRLGPDDAEVARLFLYRLLNRYLDLHNAGMSKRDIIASLDRALMSDRYAERLRATNRTADAFSLTHVIRAVD